MTVKCWNPGIILSGLFYLMNESILWMSQYYLRNQYILYSNSDFIYWKINDTRHVHITHVLTAVMSIFLLFYFFKISVRLLSVLRGHSVFSSPPQRPMTSDFEGFSIPHFIHYIYFPILTLEKEPVFSLLNVQC